jgi:hypothetical protein
MKIVFILLSFICISCSHYVENHVNLTDNNIDEIDSTSNEQYLNTRKKLEPFVFTTEINRINDSNIPIPNEMKDLFDETTPNYGLLDFNKDGFDDLFFEYYGLSGSGEKNTVEIFFYEPLRKEYSDTSFKLMNPSFFYDKNIITAYYYGVSGGSAEMYQIENGKFDLIEQIEIDIHSESNFEVFFNYSQKPFLDTIKTKDNLVRLPPEYKYCPLITPH